MSRPLLTACAALAAAGVVAAQHGTLEHRFERAIVTTGAGPHRLAPDVALLSGAAAFDRVAIDDSREPRARASSGLADLRLYAADGREVPYLLVYPPVHEPQLLPAAVLPLADTEKTSGFEADLGAVAAVDAIRVHGLTPPFLKRLVLEGSGDREHWTMLAPEATLFHLPEEGLALEVVPFRAGDYRYLRVTWDDANSGRVPLPRTVSARRVTPGAVEHPSPSADVPIERRPSEPGISRYRVRLPAARLPIVALVLEAGGGHVFRGATVTESRVSGRQAAPAVIGRATLSRVVRDGLAASALRVPMTPPQEAEIDLVVEDGDNPPLDITRATVQLAELPWIYFEAPDGVLTARYGDRQAPAPRYDLEAARESIRIGTVAEARWAGNPVARDSEPAPAPAALPPGAPLDPAMFRHGRDVPAVRAGLVALPLDAAVLAESRRFDDVRLLDQEGRQVPYLLERREEPLSIDVPVAPHTSAVSELQAGGSRRFSTYRVRLPHANLPSATLVLATTARVFSRTVQLGYERPPDRQRRGPWFDARASGVWRHADPSTPPPLLSMPIHAAREQDVVIVVDEGDNSPLPIASARLLLPSYRVRFYHPGPALRLVYGNDEIGAPQYDLALLAPSVMGAAAEEIALAAEQAGGPQPSARPSLVTPAVFWTGITVAVLVLLALMARLVRKETTSRSSAPRP